MEYLKGIKPIRDYKGFSYFKLTTDIHQYTIRIPYKVITHKDNKISKSIYYRLEYSYSIKDYCINNNINYTVYYSY